MNEWPHSPYHFLEFSFICLSYSLSPSTLEPRKCLEHIVSTTYMFVK